MMVLFTVEEIMKLKRAGTLSSALRCKRRTGKTFPACSLSLIRGDIDFVHNSTEAPRFAYLSFSLRNRSTVLYS